MYFKYFIFLIVVISSCLAVNVSIAGTLNIGKELVDVIADRVVASLRNSRRSLMPVQEDKLTLIVRHSLFEITTGCDNCTLYKFIEEYIIVLARTLSRVIRRALGPQFVEDDYQKLVTEYVEYTKEVLLDNTEENNPTFWIVTIKIINSKFQKLITVYNADVDSNRNDLRHKIVLAAALMENNYINILCVEHDMCLTNVKLTSTIRAVLEELTKAPLAKYKFFLNSLYRALYDTKLYTFMDEEFAHQTQLQFYELVENPSRKLLLDFQMIVEKQGTRETLNTTHVDLIHAILSDLDTVYVVQSAVPLTKFLESFYVFLKNDVKLNLSKLLLEIQKVISSLSNEFLHKLRNEFFVLLDILLGTVSTDVLKPVISDQYSS